MSSIILLLHLSNLIKCGSLLIYLKKINKNNKFIDLCFSQKYHDFYEHRATYNYMALLFSSGKFGKVI